MKRALRYHLKRERSKIRKLIRNPNSITAIDETAKFEDFASVWASIPPTQPRIIMSPGIRDMFRQMLKNMAKEKVIQDFDHIRRRQSRKQNRRRN